MGRAEDRINDLPEELLHSILSMLPLKSAIRTSALSRRWAHLWRFSLTSATALDFGADFACGQSPAQLVATLGRYLRLRGDAALHRLCVVFCPFDAFARDIEAWVRAAVGKGLRELELDLSQGVVDAAHGWYVDGRAPLELPSCLFQCGNALTRLSLRRCDLAGPPASGGFARLRSLLLTHAGVTDDALQGLLSNCPVLESLSLRSCRLLTSVRVVGEPHGLRLRSLEIVECWGVHEVEVAAPLLRSFAFHGHLCAFRELVGAAAMEDAYVSLVGTEDFGSEDEYIRLLSGVAHAKILTLCSVGFMHLIEEEEYNTEEFPIELQNLKELQLVMDSASGEHLSCISTFFQLCAAPFVEHLLIHLPSELEDPPDINGLSPVAADSSDVAFAHLKFVKVVNFRGTIPELRLVKFLLEKASLLESLIVVTPETHEEKEDMQEERLHLKILRGQLSMLQMLQKASLEARLVVCQPTDDRSLNPTHMRIYHEEYLRGVLRSVSIAPIVGTQNVLVYPQIFRVCAAPGSTRQPTNGKECYCSCMCTS